MTDKNHRIRHDFSLISQDDVYLMGEGSHFRLYDKLGARTAYAPDETPGTYFAVWAPGARQVNVMGDFNGWVPEAHPLRRRDGGGGIWEGFVTQLGPGEGYKYHIFGQENGYRIDKADPFGLRHETPPKTASVVWHLDYTWNDADWMAGRHAHNHREAPIALYEMHLGSWLRDPQHPDRFLRYGALAERLADYVHEAGFTHVEFMPVMEHPFYGSWGYQATGYFAPTSRYGTPQDFMYLVDYLHQRGIGVVLDWAPGHFPDDAHGLAYFDGTHLFEDADPRRGVHPDWNSFIFNYSRKEVQSFLLSSALFWAEKYHVDGLRVDAVTSMLRLDYSRKEGAWLPNQHGGPENLEAIAFLRRFNSEMYAHHPDVQTFAEEATAWPMVSRPTYVGGLGFGFKWDMGWMNDTLTYFETDPVHRKGRHDKLTFRPVYAFNESYVLPLSHDEVVHGKKSLLGRMPGDDWQRFANLRLLFGNQYLQPGKKLVFMGGEFGQWKEWAHDEPLDWALLDFDTHNGMRRWVRDLNTFYRQESALHATDTEQAGFAWVDCLDNENSVIGFLRMHPASGGIVLAVFNHTPLPRDAYRMGVPRPGYWQEVLNSDAAIYGGAGRGNMGGCTAENTPSHQHPQSLRLHLPPLSCLVFKNVVS